MVWYHLSSPPTIHIHRTPTDGVQQAPHRGGQQTSHKAAKMKERSCRAARVVEEEEGARSRRHWLARPQADDSIATGFGPIPLRLRRRSPTSRASRRPISAPPSCSRTERHMAVVFPTMVVRRRWRAQKCGTKMALPATASSSSVPRVNVKSSSASCCLLYWCSPQ